MLQVNVNPINDFVVAMKVPSLDMSRFEYCGPLDRDLFFYLGEEGRKFIWMHEETFRGDEDMRSYTFTVVGGPQCGFSTIPSMML